METNLAEIKVRGKAIKVLSTCINNRTVAVTGKWVRMAAVHDEDWLEGQVVEDPELFIAGLRQEKLKADIFTFAQKIPNTKPRYKYPLRWDNVAAIPITSFAEWWNSRPRRVRQDVNRARNRGVTVKIVEFNDDLVQGIIGIHNADPIRQGIPFKYYGMDFDAVKKGYSTYIDRSEFIGAYHESELIGIIKIVYLGELAYFMEILSKSKHFDKRPTNALIAKSVEICEKKRKSYLTYGKYQYGNKKQSSLMEFKRRNGFQKMDFPRYYVPLTLKGKIFLMLKLHRGLLGILPGGVINFLRDLRSTYYKIILRPLKLSGSLRSHKQDERLRGGEAEDDG